MKFDETLELEDIVLDALLLVIAGIAVLLIIPLLPFIALGYLGRELVKIMD